VIDRARASLQVRIGHTRARIDGTLLVLAALSPAIVLRPALAALASVTSVLAALVVFERVRFADLRQQHRER
jgi:hypothetical protein